MDFEDNYEFYEDFDTGNDEFDSEISSDDDSDSSISSKSSSDENSSESDSESLDENFNNEIEDEQIIENIKKKKKNYIGFPFLTKFEKTRILGIRTEQITAGSQVFVEYNLNENAYDIALRELYEKKMPLIIRRFFGSKFKDISVNSLKIIN